MPDSPIIAVMIHAADWRAATLWYAQAFPHARRVLHEPDDFGHLQLGRSPDALTGGTLTSFSPEPQGETACIRCY